MDERTNGDPASSAGPRVAVLSFLFPSFAHLAKAWGDDELEYTFCQPTGDAGLWAKFSRPRVFPSWWRKVWAKHGAKVGCVFVEIESVAW